MVSFLTCSWPHDIVRYVPKASFLFDAFTDSTLQIVQWMFTINKANAISLPAVSSLTTVFFTLKCHGATRDSNLQSNSNYFSNFFFFFVHL